MFFRIRSTGEQVPSFDLTVQNESRCLGYRVSPAARLFSRLNKTSVVCPVNRSDIDSSESQQPTLRGPQSTIFRIGASYRLPDISLHPR